MAINIITGLLIFTGYLLADFLIFKYFIYNKKGLLQIILQKIKSTNKGA
jgi:hypothetical protein